MPLSFRPIEVGLRTRPLVRLTWLYAGRWSRSCIHILCRIRRETAAAAAADLTALATGLTRLVGRPLVSGALFMRRAAALAGDLTLLLWRHRRKTATFFSYSVHSTPPGY